MACMCTGQANVLVRCHHVPTNGHTVLCGLQPGMQGGGGGGLNFTVIFGHTPSGPYFMTYTSGGCDLRTQVSSSCCFFSGIEAANRSKSIAERKTLMCWMAHRHAQPGSTAATQLGPVPPVHGHRPSMAHIAQPVTGTGLSPQRHRRAQRPSGRPLALCAGAVPRHRVVAMSSASATTAAAAEAGAEEGQAGPLTSAQLSFFHTFGYLHLRRAFSLEDVAMLTQRADQLAARSSLAAGEFQPRGPAGNLEPYFMEPVLDRPCVLGTTTCEPPLAEAGPLPVMMRRRDSACDIIPLAAPAGCDTRVVLGCRRPVWDTISALT
eukprot:SAG25_NODE_590_length_6705_cov_22.787012_4_plen_321_part_00